MDVWCDAAMTAALRPLAASLASEEADAEIAGAAGKSYSVAFDPLDGSSNLDASLPTGTIFGAFRGGGFVGRHARRRGQDDEGGDGHASADADPGQDTERTSGSGPARLVGSVSGHRGRSRPRPWPPLW